MKAQLKHLLCQKFEILCKSKFAYKFSIYELDPNKAIDKTHSELISDIDGVLDHYRSVRDEQPPYHQL